MAELPVATTPSTEHESKQSLTVEKGEGGKIPQRGEKTRWKGRQQREDESGEAESRRKS